MASTLPIVSELLVFGVADGIIDRLGIFENRKSHGCG
jgi:hypothetical protein